MPTKNPENPPIYYSIGNVEYHKLGLSIPSIEMSSTEKIRGDSINTNRSYEISFTVSDLKPANGLTLNELWMILSGVCEEWQIVSNNWRRLHGLPMKRKRRR